jgi:transcriptional regulator with XRE-family HTH domain
MPTSLLKHNLARLRAELRLTQADLAALVNRSPSAIKYVEIGNLDLSPKLAALVSEVTGAPAEWLLKNDLSEPVPPQLRVSNTYDPDGDEYRLTCGLLKILFNHFLSALDRLKDGDGKDKVIQYVEHSIDRMRKGKAPDNAFASHTATTVMLDFFHRHPEKLDLDLRGLIDLDLLLHLRRKELSSWKSVPKLETSGEVSADASSSQTQKQPPQKSPSQNPVSPLPAGRRKNRASS